MEWKEILGYEGRYLVSKCGKVWSRFSNKELSQAIKKGGYSHVRLTLNGVSKDYLVHRLVAELFCEKGEGCDIVNHIIPLSQGGTNHADNLEWTTMEKNLSHKIVTGTSGKGLTKNGRKVNQVDPKTGEVLATYKSISEAGSSTNTNIGNIGSVLTGLRKTAGGYKWEYVEVE